MAGAVCPGPPLTSTKPGPRLEHAYTITFGPEAIARVHDALDIAMPALERSRFRILPNGNLEFAEAEPAEALLTLRDAVETLLPDEIRDRLGAHSGLGWNIFFGHVVAWWLPQRRGVGFLRALVDRAALHHVALRLHWNAGRAVTPTPMAPSNTIVAVGGIVGAIVGLIITRRRPWDSVLGFIAVGVGLVAARLYQRIARRRLCGDRLCRAPLPRSAEMCPDCGAQLGPPRAPRH